MFIKLQKIGLIIVILEIFAIIQSSETIGWNAAIPALNRELERVFDRNTNMAYASTSNLTSGSNEADILDVSAIIVAIISLVSAAVVAILTYIFNRKQHVELTNQNKHLEELKSNLETQKDEKAAKRDYEYDARKNLYVQFEPLLFQLHELSHRAYERITQLVEDFRRKNLRADGGWLFEYDGFYFTMTLYLLLAPVGIFYLMSRRLTQFDLQLESFYDNQYLLAKLIYRTFSHDFKLASYKPNIHDYKPDITLTADPDKAHKQGIDAELLDQIAQAFIIRDPLDNTIRIRTYGEFYSIWKKPDGEFNFKQLEYLLKNFHPKNRGVLWRILIAQAHIYQLLIENYLSNDSTDISEKIPLMNSEEEQMKLFDWRNEEDKKKILDDDIMEPLTAVKEYLKHDVAVDYKKYRGRHKGIKSSNKAHE